MFNVLQKCTFIHVLIVHSCYAKIYIFVVQKCTLLQGWERLLKKGVNNVNAIAGGRVNTKFVFITLAGSSSSVIRFFSKYLIFNHFKELCHFFSGG